MRAVVALDWRVLVVGLGTMVAPLDASVNVAFPAIVGAFGLPIAQIQWVVIVYMLAQTSLMLVFGRIGDMVGYRRVFLAGSAVSAAGLLLCALSPSYAMLLVGRTMQGVGAGLVLSCGPALATSLQPEAMRARVLGLYTMLYSAGFAFGPAIAGVLVGWFGWQSVFWFRVPIAAAAFAGTLALPHAPRREGAQRFDGLGAALLILGMAASVLAIDRLQHLDAGRVWPAVASVLAAALLWGFARQERRTPQPILDLGLFRLPGFARVTLAAALANLACFVVLLLLPFYLATALGLGPRPIGAVLASTAVGLVTASPVAGAIAGRIGPRKLMLAGCTAIAVGLAVVALAPPLGCIVAALLVQGFGQGLFMVAFLDVVTATLPAHSRGVAGSLGMLTRTLGVVLGASLLTLAFRSLSGLGFLAAFQGSFAVAAGVAAVGFLLLFAGDAAAAPRGS